MEIAFSPAAGSAEALEAAQFRTPNLAKTKKRDIDRAFYFPLSIF
jgi:hypothetical protein